MEAPGSPLAWRWQPLHVPWLHVSLRRHLGVHVPETPRLWRAHMAPADSSPTQGSSGGVVMKGINAGTRGQKKSYFLVWKILVRDAACYYQLRFSEIDLPSPGENEVRQ